MTDPISGFLDAVSLPSGRAMSSTNVVVSNPSTETSGCGLKNRDCEEKVSGAISGAIHDGSDCVGSQGAVVVELSGAVAFWSVSFADNEYECKSGWG
jgi:hypothetical protein